MWVTDVALQTLLTWLVVAHLSLILQSSSTCFLFVVILYTVCFNDYVTLLRPSNVLQSLFNTSPIVCLIITEPKRSEEQQLHALMHKPLRTSKVVISFCWARAGFGLCSVSRSNRAYAVSFGSTCWRTLHYLVADVLCHAAGICCNPLIVKLLALVVGCSPRPAFFALAGKLKNETG